MLSHLTASLDIGACHVTMVSLQLFIIVIIILIIILITASQSLAPRGRQPGGCGQDARPAHDPGPGGVQCRGRSEVRIETFYEIFSSLVTAAG